MPMDSASTFNWVYLLLLLPAAVYYGIRISDSLRRKESAQADDLGTPAKPGARVGGVVRVEQRELSNRPPFVLSLVLLACSLLFLAS